MKFGYGAAPWMRNNHLENFYRMLDEMSLEGIDGIELCYQDYRRWYGHKPQEFRRLLEMHEIELASYYCGVGFRTPELNAESVERAKDTYRFAAELGCKNALIDEAGGRLPLPCDMPDYVKRVAEGANEMGRFVKSLGMTLSWHNHWGSIFETPEPFNLFVPELDNDLCGLCFDVGQLKLGGFDEVETVRRYTDRVKFMHYKDVTFVGRPNKPLYAGGPNIPSDSGAYDVDSKGRWIEMGRGEVDFVGITAALREVNYDGWIVDDLDITPYDPRVSLRACKEYLNYGLGIWTEKDKRLGLAPADAK